MSAAERAGSSPYPGLRPFDSGEEDLFFGRETQVDDILRRLRRKRFIAVVGTSGSGKSSLVRAGMLPALYGGFMAGNEAQWRVAMLRPGSEPVANLAAALDAAGILDTIAPAGSLRIGLARAILDRGALGLVEIVQQSAQLAGENILIVVDQFEELFRFAEAAGAGAADDALAFVRLLLEAAKSPVPIYVVLTMRSDFLGDCARFRDLPETINDGLFLIPRMNREQLRAAIAGPARVAGARIAPRLITRLLNDLGDDPDELPVLQHALMRTWHLWAARGDESEPLDLADYEATGGMAAALSHHGDEVFATLPGDGSRALAVRIFKALTERGGDNRGVRRPVRFDDLCAIVEAPPDEVAVVVDAFRAPGCSLLMPPADTPLEPGTIVDIAHESLMRKWRRLARWVDEEAQSAQSYRRVAGAAALHAAGEAALWRDPDLALAIAWRDEAQPNRAWGERYAPGFDRAMAFLAAGAAERDRERRARTRRQRATVGSLAALAIVLASLLLFAGYQYAAATRELRTSQALQTGNVALALPPAKLEDALVLSVESVLDGNLETRNALYGLLERVPRLRRIFHRTTRPAFSEDGRYLALASAPSLVAPAANEEIVWDAAGDKVANRWTFATSAHEGPAIGQCLRGDRLVRVDAGGDVRAFDWRTATAATPPLWRRDFAGARSVACIPQTTLVAVGDDAGRLRIVDSASGRVARQTPVAASPLWSVAASPDGSLVAAGTDRGRISIAGTRDARSCSGSIGVDGAVSILRFLNDGTLVAASGGTSKIALLDARCRNLASIPAAGPLRGLAVHSGLRLIQLLTDGRVVGPDIYPPPEPSGGLRIDPIGHDVGGVELSPNDAWLAEDSDNGVYLSTAAPAFRPLRFIARAPGAGYRGVAFAPDDATLVAPVTNRYIDVWHFSDGAKGAGLFEPGGAPSASAFAVSPDGKTAAAAADGGRVQTYAIAPAGITYGPVFSVPPGFGIVELAFSADGSRLAARAADGRIDVLAAKDGTQISTFAPAATRASAGEERLSPNGGFVVTTSRSGLTTRTQLYSATGSLVFQQTAVGRTSPPSFSDDDALLFVRSGDHLDIWRTADGTRAGRLFVDAGAPDIVATANRTSQWIAVSTPLERGASGVQLYDFNTLLKVGAPMRGPVDAIQTLRFSTDGEWLAAVTYAGSIYVWETGLAAREQRACEIANQQPSANTWNSYGVPLPYRGVCAHFAIAQGQSSLPLP